MQQLTTSEPQPITWKGTIGRIKNNLPSHWRGWGS